MSIFGRRPEKGPVVELRTHINAFMYLVKQGESKFGNKGKIGYILKDMESTRYLFRQAISGTMYDFRGKLDYTLWDAAVHKYGEDMDHLKKELLKSVDEASLREQDEKEKQEKEEQEAKKAEERKAEDSTDWAAAIKKEVEETDQEKSEEKARREQHRKEIAERRNSEKMTSEDCKELWHLMQGMDKEFKEMNRIADDFFAVHGKKNGCLTGALFMTLIPIGAIYGLWMIL